MFNPNQKPAQEDRKMTPAEQLTMPIEKKELAIQREIEVIQAIGLNSSDLERNLKDLETNRRVILWLESFATTEEREEAVALVAREGLPPEIFASPENIPPAPTTLQ